LEHIEIGKLPFFGPIETMIVNRFNEAHTDIDFGDLHIDLEAGLPVELCDLIVRDGEMIIIGTTT
ncbi:MAG: hypothetical protein SVM79_03240, partial [Chloroflexota bacterium]|nr:hypothetical protein [Chloroflexota bacterium]